MKKQLAKRKCDVCECEFTFNIRDVVINEYNNIAEDNYKYYREVSGSFFSSEKKYYNTHDIVERNYKERVIICTVCGEENQITKEYLGQKVISHDVIGKHPEDEMCYNHPQYTRGN